MQCRRWSERRLLAAAGLAALLTGCAGLRQPDVERVATAFAVGDPATRCGLLAPATLAALEVGGSAACGAVVGGPAPSGGQIQHTEVWGDAAQVRLADDTVFLTRTGAGWKVAAAGCTPPLPLPGGGAVRAVRALFVVYLTVVGAGLAYFTLIGLLGR